MQTADSSCYMSPFHEGPLCEAAYPAEIVPLYAAALFTAYLSHCSINWSVENNFAMV